MSVGREGEVEGVEGGSIRERLIVVESVWREAEGEIECGEAEGGVESVRLRCGRKVEAVMRKC